MKVSTERTPDSQVVLEIEVEPERLERSLDKAYRSLAQRTAVPGFRKGKAPRLMLERHVGRHRLLHEALDNLIPEVYNEAIDENGIEPIDQPRIEVLQEEPPVFKATVPVRPTVELGDYRKFKVKREPVQAAPEEVEAALEELRHRYALHEPVDRPVQLGDIVRADIRAAVDGRAIVDEEDAEFRLREDGVIVFPGVAEGLLGAKKGVIHEVTVTVPEDFPEGGLAGRPCTFAVLVKEVKQERLPEPNDEFARQVGEGFPSLQALRERLEADALERKQAAADDEYREKVVDALVDRAKKIEFPPVLVEGEIERLLREEARAAGEDVDRYIEQLKRAPDQLREELRPQAEARVRRSLALTRLAELEEVTVEPAEIEAEIERIAAGAGPQGDQVRRLFSNAGGRETIGRSLLTRKTLDRLAAIAGGEKLREPAKVQK
ncbi:MAG: trigger factor [Chloroflexi bacterium]|nr:trigger factor [Chloroflexota bacterium]